MPKTLQLRDTKWTLGSRIGDRSGFGKVYEATAEDGRSGVLKVIPKEPGADRELLFGDLAGVPNIVPVIDAGETKTDWVIAMPRAKRSLRRELETTGGPLTVATTVSILTDIVLALAAMDGRVVHRDLKPENVLLLNGSWCLADFGLARYAEASTAPDTRKFAMTPAYAAPERWRAEHATIAADVYALGVIGFELLTGARPFPGPGTSEFREQHLHWPPPPLTDGPPGLAALVGECIVKAAQARPRPANVLERLRRSLQQPPPGASTLQAANHALQVASAAEEARVSAAQTESERRRELFQVGKAALQSISSQFQEAVTLNAPSAQRVRGDFDDWALRLGTATIGMDPAAVSNPGSWGHWKPLFDVIAFAAVGIIIPKDRHGYEGRVHALWYCDAQKEGAFRWFETGFMISPIVPRESTRYPLAFPPGENAGKALGPGLAEWQMAWPFTPIDQGEEAPFIERWLSWFGQAAQGRLQRPSRRPEHDPTGSWRQ